MEVHHKHHAPKNWKEYITEFIMLFAAVSIGFLAENFREQQIEQHRASEFIELINIGIKINLKYLRKKIPRIPHSAVE